MKNIGPRGKLSFAMFCHMCGHAVRDIFVVIVEQKKRIIKINNLESEKDIIEYYFKRGFQYESKLLLLSHNQDLNTSLSTLKRRLKD